MGLLHVLLLNLLGISAAYLTPQQLLSSHHTRYIKEATYSTNSGGSRSSTYCYPSCPSWHRLRASKGDDGDGDGSGGRASPDPSITTIGPELRACIPQLQDVQWDRLEQLLSLVCEWNEKVNLISRKDIDRIVDHHLMPCLGLAKLLLVEKGNRLKQQGDDGEEAVFRPVIMDVGCGGGFPGLPLAICLPEAKFVLVDSVGKKVNVVKDMAKRLGLKNVAVVHGRVEQFGPEVQVDWITGRAVTALPRFLGWVKDRLKPPGWSSTGLDYGVLYIKGGPILDESVKKEDFDARLIRASEHPTSIHPITDLLPCYQGDKAVLHYASKDLFGGGIKPGVQLHDPTKPPPPPPKDRYQQGGRGRGGGGSNYGYGPRQGRRGGGGTSSGSRNSWSSSPPSRGRRPRYNDDDGGGSWS